MSLTRPNSIISMTMLTRLTRIVRLDVLTRMDTLPRHRQTRKTRIEGESIAHRPPRAPRVPSPTLHTIMARETKADRMHILTGIGPIRPHPE